MWATKFQLLFFWICSQEDMHQEDHQKSKREKSWKGHLWLSKHPRGHRCLRANPRHYRFISDDFLFLLKVWVTFWKLNHFYWKMRTSQDQDPVATRTRLDLCWRNRSQTKITQMSVCAFGNWELPFKNRLLKELELLEQKALSDLTQIHFNRTFWFLNKEILSCSYLLFPVWVHQDSRSLRWLLIPAQILFRDLSLLVRQYRTE